MIDTRHRPESEMNFDSALESTIPISWTTSRIKFAADGSPNSFTDGDWIESPYITGEGIRLIQTGNIGIGMYKEQGFRYISEETFVKLRCKEVRVGDVLICRLADPAGRACLAPDLGVRMITSVDVCMLRPSVQFDSGYLVYYLSSPQYLSQLNSASRGGTRERISRSQLGDVPIPMPNVGEQRTIAAFLDHETARIDRLIAKQERLIELLKEKRQAVISHAVTKGLNHDAPMKDSGIEWLGEVPAHWRVAKCGHYITVRAGYAFPSKGFSASDEDVRLLRGINVGVGHIRWEEVAYWERAAGDGFDPWELNEGDLVIGMDRPLISSGVRVAKLSASDVPCLLLQRVASLEPSKEISSDWVMRILSLKDMFEAHFAPETTGVSVPHISPDQIKNFVIPIPPKTEQQLVLDFLEEKLSKLRQLHSHARMAIELLQERRSSLIAAAVTGRMDVSHWQDEASKPKNVVAT